VECGTIYQNVSERVNIIIIEPRHDKTNIVGL
jgi:hypothetical protein